MESLVNATICYGQQQTLTAMSALSRGRSCTFPRATHSNVKLDTSSDVSIDAGPKRLTAFLFPNIKANSQSIWTLRLAFEQHDLPVFLFLDLPL